MGAILAIAPGAAAFPLAASPSDAHAWSLLAATVAALGLWLWGRCRPALRAAPVPTRPAALVLPPRPLDLLPPTRDDGRPLRPAPAASWSLLRAPPGARGTSAESDAPAVLVAPGVPVAPDSRPNPRPAPFEPDRASVLR